jgi:NAD(P)-dependent dehydrogenase (short-subunit alcohol dehydrogenase family)
MLFRNNKSVSFNPERDIPALTDKVILVTGANVGLGKQAVLEFARHKPRLILLGARSVQKANAAAEEIKQQVPGAAIQVLELDLASFASVKQAAATVLSTCPRLDILMLNAGIMATEPGLTADGYEMQFGTNHMGHALLAKLLLPLLTQTASTGNDVRVVSLSSDAHSYASKPGIDFDSLKTRAEALGPLGRYHQSKLANVLWARQLAREYPQLTVAAIHPGAVQTQLAERASGLPSIVRGLTRILTGFFSTVEQGVRNQLWASVAAGVESGEYYEPVGVKGKTSAFGLDDGLARRLWDWTERELEGHVVGA